MEASFPIEFSVPSSKALLEFVKQHYKMDEMKECRFWKYGSNTTYFLLSKNKQYILRLYQANRWNKSEIQYELDFLCHLKNNGIRVSAPQCTKHGEMMKSIHAPEGERQLVIFDFAEGSRVRTNETMSWKLGESAARLHIVSKSFESRHTRPLLDLHTLAEIPSRALLDEMECENEAAFISAAMMQIKQKWVAVEAQLDKSVLHGDLFSGNCHMNERGQVTLFDFDECGPGYSAYDLAIYYWTMKREGREDSMWHRFLEGYSSVKQVSQAELDAIPLLSSIRQLWFIAQVRVIRANILGYSLSGGDFINQQIKILDEYLQSI